MDTKNSTLFLKNNKWALLWALLIFILCATPGKDIPHVSILEIVGIDKWIHASVFFILALLLAIGFRKQNNLPLIVTYPLIISLIICIVYGGLLELMQGAFYVDRTADIYDFIANSFGAIVATVFLMFRRNKI